MGASSIRIPPRSSSTQQTTSTNETTHNGSRLLNSHPFIHTNWQAIN